MTERKADNTYVISIYVFIFIYLFDYSFILSFFFPFLNIFFTVSLLMRLRMFNHRPPIGLRKMVLHLFFY